mmetsp:Transcript_30656/g.70783  ORF Transcript_30656/g.70783 Transcript_30656/m.70783 type:complete len:87 (-) Transcript_30656:817-1077(-)
MSRTGQRPGFVLARPNAQNHSPRVNSGKTTFKKLGKITCARHPEQKRVGQRIRLRIVAQRARIYEQHSVQTHVLKSNISSATYILS